MNNDNEQWKRLCSIIEPALDYDDDDDPLSIYLCPGAQN